MQVIDQTVWRLSRTQSALERDSAAELALVHATDRSRCGTCGSYAGSQGPEPTCVRALAGDTRDVEDLLWPASIMSYLGKVFVSPRVVDALATLDPTPTTVQIDLDARVENRHGEPGRPLGRARRDQLTSYRELRPQINAPVVAALSRFVRQGVPIECPECGNFPLSWGPPPPLVSSAARRDVAFLTGVEHFRRIEMRIDALGERDDLYERVSAADEGAAFSAAAVHGAHLWRVRGAAGALLCSSGFKAVVEEIDATGVTFLRVGRLVDLSPEDA